MTRSDHRSRFVTAGLIIILALWAAMIGAYLARHRLQPPPVREPAPPSALPQVPDQERWMGIYLDRTKIGYTYSRLRREKDRFQLWSNSRMKLKLMDSAEEVNLELRAGLDPDSSLREVEFEALSGFMEIRARGAREGNDLILKIQTGGQEIEHRLHFERPPIMDIEWAIQDLLKDPAPGTSLSFTIFEPMTQRDLPVTAKVIGEEDVELSSGTVPCLKLELSMANQSEWAWVSRATKEVVKEYHPGTGLTSMLEDREQALAVDWEAAGGVDLITSLMVPVQPEVALPRGIVYLKARLLNAPLEGLDLELPGRQSISGSTVEVAMEVAVPAIGYALPIGASLPERAAEYSTWLAPTPFIQSDHERIRQAAGEAVGDATDAVTAVDRLLAWIGREVQPSMVVSIPSALEVLEKKRGACKEHAYLFTALARALGIPARPVSGIVYSDQQMIDGFYYHAWVEVFLAGPDGRGLWVAVDPTFNQNPADASHVRLKVGELEEMISLMQVMGKLRVEVEDYR